jgi:hypothetical protein
MGHSNCSEVGGELASESLHVVGVQGSLAPRPISFPLAMESDGVNSIPTAFSSESGQRVDMSFAFVRHVPRPADHADKADERGAVRIRGP